MDVRRVALKAIIKILEKDCQADETLKYYSDKVLFPSELKGLLSGTIKYKLTLDFFIRELSTKPLKDLSPQVRNILRLAIYELEYLQNPDYAVLNSYVELAKLYNEKFGAFVNGILRNFLRKRSEIHFPEHNPAVSISIKYSHPEWMVERWIHRYGVEDTVKICQYNNLAPKLVIRTNTLKISKQKLMDFFADNNVSFSQNRMADECLLLHQHDNITNIPGFEEGYWMVQGESSCLVAKVLDPQGKESILDCCAAPGGKTTHIAALMKNKGKITAIDINSKKTKRIEENCKRLGVKIVTAKAADALTYSPKEEFDRILIDAPCSNTGVLVKRIDARWKKTPEDIDKLAELQLNILNNISKFVKAGGILIYSTCSIEFEENQQVIEKFLMANKDFMPDKIQPYLPFKVEEDKGYFQILQSRQNIDGFFIARLKKCR